MKNGIIYNKMDCLDVLETLEDNTFSLIYLDIPESIGTLSERITYDKSREKPVAALCKERGCTLRDLTSEEIQLFIAECKRDRDREYEKYLFKIAQNCLRVLNYGGVIAYRQIGGESTHADMGHVLEKFFRKFAVRVIEPISKINCRTGFDLLHFYSNRNDINVPNVYVLQPVESYPYKDKRGKYRLLSIECMRDPNNFFEWKGLLPREGKGWRYSQETLDELYKKGDIVLGETSVKQKYYREEHPVLASPIWTDRNALDRCFELFAKEGSKVLGIYEGLQFAYLAETKGLIWCSVLPKDTTRTWFAGQEKIEGRYLLKDSLKQHKVREYEINMTMQADIQKEKEDFYRKISNEYASKSVISNNIGTTTDEILCYYIDKYKEREKISEDIFAGRCGVSRQTISKMRKAAKEQSKQTRGIKEYNAVIRKKENIIKIVVYAQIPFDEARKALKASGLDFNEKLFVDEAIVQWLLDDSNDKSIAALNELIERVGVRKGIAKEIYEKEWFTPFEESKSKKIIIER